jgi:hypothetical protein
VLHEGPCGPWPEWLLKPAIKPSAPLPRQPYVGSGSHLQTRLARIIHDSTPFFISAQCTHAVCLS